MAAPSAKPKKRDATAVVPYAPTPKEAAALQAIRTRRTARKPSPRLKVTTQQGTSRIDPDHPDASVGYTLLMDATGTMQADFLGGLLSQLAHAGSKGPQPDEGDLNFMLSVVKGVEPRDEIEAMLAAQMAAVHRATMTFAHRLNHVENIQQQDSAERAFTKLARTFAAQMEALKRYRTGGEQKVTVQHVTVNEGGQAVVGHVSAAPGGGRMGKNPETTS